MDVRRTRPHVLPSGRGPLEAQKRDDELRCARQREAMKGSGDDVPRQGLRGCSPYRILITNLRKLKCLSSLGAKGFQRATRKPFGRVWDGVP